jgi:microcystin degradation protein MlrC
MRVAIAGLHAETNTFSPVEADLTPSNTTGVLRGEEIIASFAASHHTIAGFLDACDHECVDVVPLVYANAMACGTLTHEAFERVVHEILVALRDNGPFDVVLLAGHGAAVSAQHVDPEGELAARVRSLLGPEVSVGLALDLHGNVTQRLLASVDVAVGYRENPHRDAAVRGAECARLALRRARGELHPVQRLLRLPMVVPILGGWSDEGAMRDVMSVSEEIAGKHALLSYTVFHGFGYADVPHMGSSVLAVADGNRDAAERAARDLATALWRRREGLLGAALSPADAVAEAQRRFNGRGPVVLLDVGDNIGGGSTGDSTVLLAEALDRGLRGFAATLCDERAVGAAVAAGEGSQVTVSLGGTTPVSPGPTVQVTGRVTRVTDGRFEDPNPTHAGFRFYDGGPTVRLTTPQFQELVISSRTVAGLSPEQLRAVGIEPQRQRVIVAKGVVAPRAGYEPVAAHFLVADTPGVTTADLRHFTYRQRPRPLWPLERHARFEPVADDFTFPPTGGNEDGDQHRYGGQHRAGEAGLDARARQH